MSGWQCNSRRFHQIDTWTESSHVFHVLKQAPCANLWFFYSYLEGYPFIFYQKLVADSDKQVECFINLVEGWNWNDDHPFSPPPNITLLNPTTISTTQHSGFRCKTLLIKKGSHQQQLYPILPYYSFLLFISFCLQRHYFNFFCSSTNGGAFEPMVLETMFSSFGFNRSHTPKSCIWSTIRIWWNPWSLQHGSQFISSFSIQQFAWYGLHTTLELILVEVFSVQGPWDHHSFINHIHQWMGRDWILQGWEDVEFQLRGGMDESGRPRQNKTVSCKGLQPLRDQSRRRRAPTN